jgi:hypothetical protein
MFSKREIITSIIFSDSFQNKKKRGKIEKSKTDRRRKKKDGNSLTSFLLFLRGKKKEKKIADVRLIVSLSE